MPSCFRTPRRASFCFGTSIVNHHIHRESILKLIEKHRPLKRSADQLIGLVCRLLSVSRIVVEEAKFDLYKIQNPDVEVVEYQQEPQYGFDNLETKTPTFMGMIRNKLIKRLKAKYDNMVHTTFGYLTRIGRLPNERLFHPHHHIKSRLHPRACPWVTVDKELCQPHG